jgi:hypothetical protein
MRILRCKLYAYEQKQYGNAITSIGISWKRTAAIRNRGNWESPGNNPWSNPYMLQPLQVFGALQRLTISHRYVSPRYGCLPSSTKGLLPSLLLIGRPLAPSLDYRLA